MNRFWQKAGVLTIVFAMAAGTVLANSIEAGGGDPASIVERTAGSILNTLDNRWAEFEAQPELLREVVRTDLLPLIDLEYSSRLILGKASRGLSEEQLTAFSDAMSNVLINRYADGLLQFRSKEQLEIMPLKGDNTEKLTLVRTRVKLENGGFAPVDYRFHMTSAGWKAFDVMVEGVSYVITLNGQYSKLVQANGIDKVTADILAGNTLPNE